MHWIRYFINSEQSFKEEKNDPKTEKQCSKHCNNGGKITEKKLSKNTI
jgi:hypothetical protein